MAELRAMFERLGFSDVQTLLQSGNVVFGGDEQPREAIETLLADEAERAFGRRIEFFVRTAAEWHAIVSANPFPHEGESDGSHLLVVVSKQAPDPALIESTDAANPGPEILRAVGDCLYVYFPDDIGHSKLVRTAGWRKIDAGGTSRNWNTTRKLDDLLRA
jgi:uncharacterized protein (DUF1697 family)